MIKTNVSDLVEDVVDEVSRKCLATRSRRISRVLTAIYDQHLRPYGISSPQFTLLVVIARLGSASRAEIGRANYQERSTLTRNLDLMLAEGWIEDAPQQSSGRSRPIKITKVGRNMLRKAAPAWRQAQEKAKRLLGEGGVAAVLDMAQHLPHQAV
jgi:DNA-binding MarR family transcriptional regulator